MFGLFKKKISTENMFAAQLSVVASRFAHVINAIDPEFAKELQQRAINNYEERTPDESQYSVSDFYFDAFTGAVFELMDRRRITPTDSLAIFSMVDTFLTENREYYTNLATSLMNSWQEKLLKTGVMGDLR